MHPTTNAYWRTFFIKAADYGTAFTIDVDDEEYLITARHLVDTSLKQFDIQIFINEVWRNIPVVVVGHCKGNVDISVLRPLERLTPNGLPLASSAAGIVFGQDMYFLGFPFKMWGDVGEFLHGRPCPFVKKGTLSFASPEGDQEFFIDAINNEGFSGGPLVFFPPANPTQMQVAAVVSKFKIEYEPVLDDQFQPTSSRIAYNTGFLVAYGIKNAVDLIRNPPSN